MLTVNIDPSAIVWVVFILALAAVIIVYLRSNGAVLVAEEETKRHRAYSPASLAERETLPWIVRLRATGVMVARFDTEAAACVYWRQLAGTHELVPPSKV